MKQLHDVPDQAAVIEFKESNTFEDSSVNTSNTNLLKYNTYVSI